MMHPLLLQKPRLAPVLDEEFRPAVLGNRAFREAVRSSRKPRPVTIAIERNDGAIAAHATEVFPEGHEQAAANLPYVERLVKMLLWKYGGFRILVSGPKEVGEHIRRQYAPDGPLTFDARLMGDVYERTFAVEADEGWNGPTAREPKAKPRGRHLDGCRIGFDAGASDRKCVAVVEGEVVFSEEVPWNPSKQADPEYHYSGVRDAFRHAAEKMPRVDAIGVSAAGVYINNRAMVASLFRSVPRDLFRSRVHDIFLNLAEEWNRVPLEVANDGEVAALAGSMGLNDTKVLGIALGSSEAGGYVSAEGCITDWLNELAFPPVDFSPTAPADEWSGDRGCGGEYFSQKAAVRLAAKAGIPLVAETMAEQLKAIQGLLEKGDGRARKIFETIGVYMGYGIAQYADFYDLRHVMLMGRVVSGEGGNIILDLARMVLDREFPDLARRIQVHLPGESSRRVGQAVAAASLPWIK